MRSRQPRRFVPEGARCAVLGHRPTFWADGATVRWKCARCGQQAGSKQYATPSDAHRYAAAFDRRDDADLGRRAPLIGLFPLRVWNRLRRGGSGRAPRSH